MRNCNRIALEGDDDISCPFVYGKGGSFPPNSGSLELGSPSQNHIYVSSHQGLNLRHGQCMHPVRGECAHIVTFFTFAYRRMGEQLSAGSCFMNSEKVSARLMGATMSTTTCISTLNF
jgi:hypothetical protein